MAKYFWDGSDTGNEGKFNTAANWQLIDGSTPGSAPPDGADLIFDERAAVVPDNWAGSDKQTKGNHFSVELAADLDQSAKNFPLVIQTPDFSGNIGYFDSGVYYGLRCTIDKLICRGSGSYYFVAEHDSGNMIDLVICDTASGALYLGKGYTAGEGREITKIINITGQCEVLKATGTCLLAPQVEELSNILAAATTIIAEGNTGTLEMKIANGNVYTDSGYTSAIIADGKLTVGNVGFFPGTALTCGPATLYKGSIDWRAYSILQGLKILGAGTCRALGGQKKTLGLSSVNSGTIEVVSGLLDLATEQTGEIVLGSDCEVLVRGSGAEYLPPRENDITW